MMSRNVSNRRHRDAVSLSMAQKAILPRPKRKRNRIPLS